MKSNTYKRAQVELDILEATVDNAIITPFREELLDLVEAFGQSGQSGGSAPFTASALSQAVKHLCLQEPICPITGADEEWNHIEGIDSDTFQNKRLSSVFKKGSGGKPYYLEAIVFQDKDRGGSPFTGNSVKLNDGSILTSRQYIRLPFRPKTFYIDVIETEWADKTETVKKPGGGWWTSVIKDESQLEEVWEYYDRFEIGEKE